MPLKPVRPWLRRGAIICLALAGGSAGAAPLAALNALEQGQWELRTRDEAGPVRRLCLGDPRQLLQIRHGRTACERFVIADGATRVSVAYDCGLAGTGRTDLRVETRRLIQIHSQGVADGAPFAFALEGRRIGACR